MKRQLRNRNRQGLSLDNMTKAELVKLARSMGIPATSRWGDETIRTKIKEA